MYLVKNVNKRYLQTGILTILVLVLVLSSFSSVDKKDKEGGVNIKSASSKLQEAILQRNFADAKEVVNEILPWMKLDIKNDKKTLSQLGKSADETEINKKDFSATLDKNNKLYKSTKKLVETSPAAIRVKGKDLVKLVHEYADLIE